MHCPSMPWQLSPRLPVLLDWRLNHLLKRLTAMGVHMCAAVSSLPYTNPSFHLWSIPASFTGCQSTAPSPCPLGSSCSPSALYGWWPY
jgi:hypothetical protein